MANLITRGGPLNFFKLDKVVFLFIPNIDLNERKQQLIVYYNFI